MARTQADRDADALLKTVFSAFKRQAAEAIREAQAKITNVLKVDYDAPEAARPPGLSVPRLQLRWEEASDGMWERVCHYEMVFPLREHDCRNDSKTNFAVVALGRTRQGGARPDWGLDLGWRTPFRDGAHAQWDSAVFGGLPVYVIAPDGRFALMETKPPLDVEAA